MSNRFLDSFPLFLFPYKWLIFAQVKMWQRRDNDIYTHVKNDFLLLILYYKIIIIIIIIIIMLYVVLIPSTSIAKCRKRKFIDFHENKSIKYR